MRCLLMLACLAPLATSAVAGAQQWRDPSPHQVRFVTVDSTVKIVDVTGANLFMFLSNEADVLREIRAFAATLTTR